MTALANDQGASSRWLELDGTVNSRDLGGLPTMDGGTTTFGRVIRSDNLQSLSAQDVQHLTEVLDLRDVIDLRSRAEVGMEGPGPLAHVPRVRIHQMSFFNEASTDEVDADKALPWQDRRIEGPAEDIPARIYLGYLTERPDSVVSALRVVAHGEGTTIVHCAAGKDRTGVVTAFALELAGVSRQAIIDDYMLSGERVPAIVARLAATTTYAVDISKVPVGAHMPQAHTINRLLEILDAEHGGVTDWLDRNGWTGHDTTALRSRLLA